MVRIQRLFLSTNLGVRKNEQTLNLKFSLCPNPSASNNKSRGTQDPVFRRINPFSWLSPCRNHVTAKPNFKWLSPGIPRRMGSEEMFQEFRQSMAENGISPLIRGTTHERLYYSRTFIHSRRLIKRSTSIWLTRLRLRAKADASGSGWSTRSVTALTARK
jgi:hypothetical protein